MSTNIHVGNLPLTVALITMVYRGRSQQCTSISQAIHFLRREAIKTGWFHTITADITLVAPGDVRQTQALRGQKCAIIVALQHLDRDTKQRPP